MLTLTKAMPTITPRGLLRQNVSIDITSASPNWNQIFEDKVYAELNR